MSALLKVWLMPYFPRAEIVAADLVAEGAGFVGGLALCIRRQFGSPPMQMVSFPRRAKPVDLGPHRWKISLA